MVKSSICESLGIVDALVQAHNSRNVVLAKVAEVSFWSMLWIAYASFTTGITMIFNLHIAMYVIVQNQTGTELLFLLASTARSVVRGALRIFLLASSYVASKMCLTATNIPTYTPLPFDTDAQVHTALSAFAVWSTKGQDLPCNHNQTMSNIVVW